MKLGEKLHYDDGNLTVEQAHDFGVAADRARLMRDAGKQYFGDSHFVGTVTRKQVEVWAKEAGVRMDDTAAVSEIIKRNLMSGEFSKLRVWEGSY